jgi:hypothetical protein
MTVHGQPAHATSGEPEPLDDLLLYQETGLWDFSDSLGATH